MVHETIIDKPLAGVLVADFTTRGPGPYSTELLARMGARVIKLESVGGDPARAMPPVFELFNAGKESVECDLSSPDGLALARAVSIRADVLVNSWRSGDAERRGLGWEQLAPDNPALVHCTISGFGPDVELSRRPGQDLSYLAASGALAMLQPGALAIPGIPLGDTLAGFHGAMRVCAALYRARLSGRGGTIEVSVAATLAEPARIGELAQGTPLDAATVSAGKGIFETNDGRALVLAIVGETPYWRALCDALGLAELRAIGSSERAERATELQAIVRKRIAGLTAEECESRLADAEIPWSWVEQPGKARLGGAMPPPTGDAPRLGSSSEVVRREFLARS